MTQGPLSRADRDLLGFTADWYGVLDVGDAATSEDVNAAQHRLVALAKRERGLMMQPVHANPPDDPARHVSDFKARAPFYALQAEIADAARNLNEAVTAQVMTGPSGQPVTVEDVARDMALAFAVRHEKGWRKQERRLRTMVELHLPSSFAEWGCFTTDLTGAVLVPLIFAERLPRTGMERIEEGARALAALIPWQDRDGARTRTAHFHLAVAGVAGVLEGDLDTDRWRASSPVHGLIGDGTLRHVLDTVAAVPDDRGKVTHPPEVYEVRHEGCGREPL